MSNRAYVNVTVVARVPAHGHAYRVKPDQDTVVTMAMVSAEIKT